MNKLISKIVGACLGLSLATGVGVGVAVGQQDFKEVKAAASYDFSGNTLVFADQNLENGVQYSDPFTNGTVSVTFGGGGNDGKYYTAGTGIRTYGGGNFTVSSSGANINKLDFSWDGSYKPTSNVANVGTFNNPYTSWTGDANSVTFTRPSGSGHWRLQSIIFTLAGGSSVAVTGVSISPETASLTVGSTQQLTATISPSDATNKNVTWSSSNENVATVSNSGLVTAIDSGSSTITVTTVDGEKTDTCDVTVSLPTITNKTVAEAITIASALNDGATSTAYYRIVGYVQSITTPYDGSFSNISFTITDSISGGDSLTCFRVKCDAETAADIKATAKISIVGQLQKYVKDSTTTYEVVNSIPSQFSILEQGRDPITSDISFSDALLLLAGLSHNIPTYDKYTIQGVVTGVTYNYNSSTNKISFNIGQTKSATDTINIYNLVVTEAQAGTILPGAVVKVTGNLENYLKNSSDYFELINGENFTLISGAPSIAINEGNQSLYVGGSASLTVTTQNIGSAIVSWSSSDETVATVAQGSVSAVSVGTTTITASVTVNGDVYSSTITITVSAPVSSVISIGDLVELYYESNYLVDFNNTTYGSSGSETNAMQFTVYAGSVSNTFAFENNGMYLSWTSGNTLNLSSDLNEYSSWTANGTSLTDVTIANAYDSARIIQYNSNSPRFACYTGTQKNACIKIIDIYSVSSVTLSQTAASIAINGSVTLTATINPSTATIQTVTWLSDDEDVATVLNGVVSGVAAGTATITAFADENSNGTLDSGEKSATCVVTVTSAPTPSSDGEWVLESIANLTSSDIFVIVGNNGDNYAMSNNNGTSNPPSAVQVTVADGKITSQVSDSIKWNISSSASGYTFYPNGDSENWLYCINANNGVRVGTGDNKTFDIEDESGYLVNAGTSRYIGVYNSQDWRCYTSINNNISGQSFEFYKYVEATEDLASKYADLFLEKLSTGDNAVCQVTQSGEVQTVLANLVSAWSTLKTQFNALSSDDQDLFTNGQANENGTNIQKAIALYDYIATKYNTQLGSDYNFMGRSISNARQMVNILNVSENPAIPAIVVVIALATVTTGAYFFLRKKKEN